MTLPALRRAPARRDQCCTRLVEGGGLSTRAGGNRARAGSLVDRPPRPAGAAQRRVHRAHGLARRGHRARPLQHRAERAAAAGGGRRPGPARGRPRADLAPPRGRGGHGTAGGRDRRPADAGGRCRPDDGQPVGPGATARSTSRCCASATAGRSAWTSPGGRRRPAPRRASRRDARKPRRPRSQVPPGCPPTRPCATTGADRVGAGGRDERQLAAAVRPATVAGDAHPALRAGAQHRRPRDGAHAPVGRVGFGSGYAGYSLVECFRENIERFQPLLPVEIDEPAERLAHLRLHNGTIGAGTGRSWASTRTGERTCASSTGRWPPGRRSAT